MKVLKDSYPFFPFLILQAFYVAFHFVCIIAFP